MLVCKSKLVSAPIFNIEVIVAMVTDWKIEYIIEVLLW